MDKPAFEVICTKSGHTYKIWAEGRVEGFPPNVTIVNRIAIVVAAAIEAAIEDERSAHDIPREDN